MHVSNERKEACASIRYFREQKYQALTLERYLHVTALSVDVFITNLWYDTVRYPNLIYVFYTPFMSASLQASGYKKGM